MRRTVLAALAVAMMAVLLLATGGCVAVRRVKLETRTAERTVELGDAESVDVEIEMGMGRLSVEGGADGLLEAEFTYNVDAWEPEVEYDVRRGEGELSVRQPSVSGLNVGNVRYEWDLKLGDEAPMDIRLMMGTGQAVVDLEEVDVTSLDLGMGVGDVRLELTGDHDHDVQVDVEGGVGNLVIVIPEDVGARLAVSGGLGSVTANEFVMEDGAYVNDAYDNARYVIDVEVDGGVGNVEVELD